MADVPTSSKPIDSPGPRSVAVAATRPMVQQRLTRRGRRMIANLNPLGWFCLDISIALFSAMLASAVTPHVDSLAADVSPLAFGIAYSIVVSVIAHIAGLHDPRFPRAAFNAFARMSAVVALSMSLLLVELNVVHFIKVGRYIVFVTAIASVVLMFLARLIAWHYSHSFRQTVCFLGGDAFCFRATHFTEDHPNTFRFLSLTDSAPELTESTLAGWSVEKGIDEVVFDGADEQIDDESLLECLDEGIKVSSYSDFVEENYYLVPVEQINAKWMFSAQLDLAHPYYHGIKRIVDLLASTVGLILSSPLLLMAILAIKLESRGPAFYSQIRTGRFNRPFRIYKLRTMVQYAEKNGAQWAKTTDSRITRIGKFLRRTRIDEIPQFWNVLKGEMSLVGPRPERPEFVHMLGEQLPFYVQRHLVNPGLTGWAQINYPYGASVEDALNKLTYDLYYVKRASVGLDIQILLRTVGAMMKGSR